MTEVEGKLKNGMLEVGMRLPEKLWNGGEL